MVNCDDMKSFFLAYSQSAADRLCFSVRRPVDDEDPVRAYGTRSSIDWQAPSDPQRCFMNCALGRLFGYEFKWQGQVRQATRQEFMAAYPDAEVTTVTRENFTDFIE